MNSTLLKTYRTLNDLAESSGIVIFGGSRDMEIPLCELKQAFSLDSPLYNRSIPGLTIANAASCYDQLILPLHPGTLLLHLGEADLDRFSGDPSQFDQHYRELILHIRETSEKENPRMRVAVVTFPNPDNDPVISDMNRHLRYLADSERCEFADIEKKPVWNPSVTKDVTSFLYSTGFVRPLKQQRPLFDLVKILFCYQ